MNFIRNVIALVCVLVLSVNLSFAQTKVIDSLRNEINKTPEKDRGSLYLDLSYELMELDPIGAKEFTRKAYELSLANYDSVLLIRSRMRIAYLIRYEDSDSSLVMGIKTLAMAEKCPMDHAVFVTMNRIAVNYIYRGKYDRALHFLLKGLELPYAKGNRWAMKALWNNLGLVYYKIKYFEKALFAYNEGLGYSDLSEQDFAANTFFNMSLCESHQKNFRNSRDHIMKGRKICPGDCTSSEGVHYYFSLSTYHFLKGNYDSVLIFTDRSHGLALKHQDVRMQVSSLEMKAKSYLKLNRIDLAEHTISQARSLVTGSNLHSEIKDVYAVLASVAERKRDYKMMAAALKKYVEELDSTDAAQNRVNLMKLEVESKEREHREEIRIQEMYLKAKEDIISTQRLLIIAVFVICVLFSILLVVFIKRHRQKTQHNKLLDKNLQLRTNELHDEMRSAFKAQLFQRELVDKMLVDIGHQMTSMKALLKFISSDETQRDACIKKSETLFDKIETSMRKIKTVISDGAEIHK
ncbi:tetratricopeptide repeat protein [Pseudochryseolinea flava]|uniref:Tetratricopeptide repeat protein n=1 Tax=Pseudochryseolinea flava TaxID=2059302 RepID=A0A364Y6D0_9BACT|nr:hypothetical protein [Pseudochryseolinea flava]RAW01658.1 hypothetical protein DQQ10_08365 [Pseudochryseolinea flava]